MVSKYTEISWNIMKWNNATILTKLRYYLIVQAGFKIFRASKRYDIVVKNNLILWNFHKTLTTFQPAFACSKLKTVIEVLWTLCWCLYCELWTYFILCSNVSVINFEHAVAGWACSLINDMKIRDFLEPPHHLRKCNRNSASNIHCWTLHEACQIFKHENILGFGFSRKKIILASS